MASFSNLINLFSNNLWPYFAVLMMVEVLIIDVIRLKIGIAQVKFRGNKISILTRGAAQRSFSQCNQSTEVKIVMILQCMVLFVGMILESRRGVTQLLRDVAPIIPWQIWTVLMLSSTAALLMPVMFDREYYLKPGRIFVSAMAFLVTVDTVASDGRELAGIALIMLAAYAFYWALKIWFFVAQYAVLLMLDVYELGKKIATLVREGFFLAVKTVYGILSGEYGRRKRAEWLARKFEHVAHNIEAKEVEFEVPAIVDKMSGVTTINVYDILFELQLEAELEAAGLSPHVAAAEVIPFDKYRSC